MAPVSVEAVAVMAHARVLVQQPSLKLSPLEGAGNIHRPCVRGLGLEQRQRAQQRMKRGLALLAAAVIRLELLQELRAL